MSELRKSEDSVLRQAAHSGDNSSERGSSASAFAPSIWWQAIRPRSFAATLSPIAIGIAIAALEGAFAPGWAVLTLLGALLLQAGTNLLNDFFDFRSGVDTPENRPTSVLTQGRLSPRAVLIGGATCFVVAAALGIVLALRGGPIIWALGMIGVAIGLLYTAGPAPLAYVGLGEIAVFFAMGVAMVLGAYVVQTRAWSAIPALAGVPIGLLVAAHLHANNLRDIPIDRASGKRTLAARQGWRFARNEYAALVIGAYVALLLLLLIAPLIGVAGLLALTTFPRASALVREAYATTDYDRLNRVLRGTAALNGRFGLLWTLGLLMVIAIRYATG